MTPIQQLMLGAGGKNKTYLDDVFSPYTYRGNSTEGNAINNGINLASKGGLVWIKNRTAVDNHCATHVPNSVIFPNTTGAASTNNSNFISSFNSNGFTLGGGVSGSNASGETAMSWTFAKNPGFFDVLEWTGNDTARTISHNLGCIPGCIMVKRTDGVNEWAVYHRDVGTGKFLMLESTGAAISNANFWNGTPTATHIGIGNHSYVNTNNASYVAYVFAGGDPIGYGSVSITSDASATTGNRLKTNPNVGFSFGTDPFTIECWFKIDGNTSNYNTLLTTRQNNSDNGGEGWSLITSGDNISFFDGGFVFNNVDIDAADGNWHHVAIVRESTSASGTKLWHNGAIQQSRTCNKDFTRNVVGIGDTVVSQNEALWGQISNVRLTKNQAIYTSGFTPSTTPLTTTSQGATPAKVSLLCCNDKHIEKFTKSSNGLIAYGSGTVGQTASPFTTPTSHNASRIFGENEDQDIIKCGSYTGNGAADGPVINLGWEPSYLLIKNPNQSENWLIWDSIRGIVTADNDARIFANSSGAETSNSDFINLTPRGFQIVDNGGDMNADTQTIVYIAIRRSDGYVQKPVKDATKVFALGTGTGNATANFASGFPVDYLFTRDITGTGDMYSAARLTGKNYSVTNSNAAEASSNAFVFDSNVGSCGSGLNSTFRAWQFKRHAGMDVVTYKGKAISGYKIEHSLSKPPEMIITKRRDPGYSWGVAHKGLNGGGDPWDWYLVLNSSNGSTASAGAWNDTAPTSTHFTLGDSTIGNGQNQKYIAMLFASVSGISSVGSYSGSSSAVTLDLGFQPRFIMIRRYNTGGTGWFVFDTLRGINAGNDPYLEMDEQTAEVNTADWVDLTSTGITLNTGVTGGHAINANGDSYVYYAHA